MSQTVEEQLSALLDNELPVEEEDLLFRRLEKNPEYRVVLGRYSLMRELIVSSDTGPVEPRLSERVRLALQNDDVPVDSVMPSKDRSGAGASLLRFGAVATVVGIALVAFVNLDYDTGGGQTIASVDPGLSYSVPEIRADHRVIEPNRLTSYLVSHGEFSNAFSRRVMDSHIVRVTPQTVAWENDYDFR
jgi:hypothetical protein